MHRKESDYFLIFYFFTGSEIQADRYVEAAPDGYLAGNPGTNELIEPERPVSGRSLKLTST